MAAPRAGPLKRARRAVLGWIFRRVQSAWLRQRGPLPDRAVIFLVPGNDHVNGGLLSISSLAEESQALRPLHGGEVFLCPYPGGRPLLRYTRFENLHRLVDLRLVLDRLDPGAGILFHVPEYWVPEAPAALAPLLAGRSGPVRCNVLLQNVDLGPSRAQVEALRALGPVTATTAHKAYSNAATAAALGCPVHHLSVWVCPERFERVAFERKERLVMVSPDAHERREEVLRRLGERLAGYRFQVVRRLTYAQYRTLARRARFSLTFGEGLDGYFVETIFSGGIGCAVYNDRFFTPKYRGLPCVHDSWDDLLARLPGEVERLEDPAAYRAAQELQFDVAAGDYRRSDYLENLERFYRAVMA